MKKITKSDLKGLMEDFSAISAQELRAYVGGYDSNDCWWRCMAYIQSCGTSYSADDAYALAKEFYGSSFDENSYAFRGSYYDCMSYISSHITNGAYCPGRILMFTPDEIPGWTDGVDGVSLRHAVIVKGFDAEKGVWNIFDPQSSDRTTINAYDLNSSSGFFINIKQKP